MSLKSTKRLVATAAICAAMLPAASLSHAAGCPMTYAQFEAAIAHVDVEECPKHDLGKKAFCRASAGGDFVHVFFFEEAGDQCLLKLQSYGEDAFELKIKPE